MSKVPEQIENVYSADLRYSSRLFGASAGIETDDPLLDSATTYFGNRFFRLARIKMNYHSNDTATPGSLPFAELEDMALRHQVMFERVVDVRRFLEEKYPEEIQAWLGSSNQTRQAYKLVLADKLSRSPGYRESFFDGDEDGFSSDCHNVIQWLEGWLRSEAN